MGWKGKYGANGLTFPWRFPILPTIITLRSNLDCPMSELARQNSTTSEDLGNPSAATREDALQRLGDWRD